MLLSIYSSGLKLGAKNIIEITKCTILMIIDISAKQISRIPNVSKFASFINNRIDYIARLQETCIFINITNIHLCCKTNYLR